VPPVVGADVVVLAGDVHAKDRGLKWIFDQKFEVPVLYVLGNHEFYRKKFPGLIVNGRKLSKKEVGGLKRNWSTNYRLMFGPLKRWWGNVKFVVLALFC